MSEIEKEMKVEARLDSKVDQILQKLQIHQGPVVTPTMTSNDRSAAQLENPGDSSTSLGKVKPSNASSTCNEATILYYTNSMINSF